ncbi:MAG: putative YggU family [Bacillota bacterium]|jgi:uncharacterized protein YggU (UPF0235/DUF167 family)
MLKINVKVIPNASFYTWKIQNDILKCYLPVTPQKNKANKLLLQNLAKLFKIPLNHITIQYGVKQRHKTILIETNLSYEEFLVKLGL